MKYRSKFEAIVIKKLKLKKIKFFYEKEKIKYVQPVIHRSYLPDLYFPSTNVYVEIKGRFKVDDRKKHIWIRESTNCDIRFCFQNPNVKLSKKSKTTYAMWCEKNNFKWCDKDIPKEWMVKNVRRR